VSTAVLVIAALPFQPHGLLGWEWESR